MMISLHKYMFVLDVHYLLDGLISLYHIFYSTFSMCSLDNNMILCIKRSSVNIGAGYINRGKYYFHLYYYYHYNPL